MEESLANLNISSSSLLLALENDVGELNRRSSLAAPRSYSSGSMKQQPRLSLSNSALMGRSTYSVREVDEEMMATGSQGLPTNSVVQIHTTGVDPSYTSPWRVNNQATWTGSGFCIADRRIVTNAHNVENATVLQVQRQDRPKKWRARVQCVAHDLDLAILRVDDEAFWNVHPQSGGGSSVSDSLRFLSGNVANRSIVELAPAHHVPALYSEVNAIGFPLGGSTVCVTKGVISRFDAHLYVHPALSGVMGGTRNSPGEVYILQVDSAINPGNSGGPAVSHDGKVVGVASSGRPGAQNVGYVIPVSIVHLFLDEVKNTGSWSGVSELGLVWRNLESDSYRSYIGMSEGQTGVLVEEVAPLGALHGVVFPGDVITHIDGFRCSNEGKVPVTIAGQQVYVPIEAIVTSKPKGEETALTILRRISEHDAEKDGDTTEHNSKEPSDASEATASEVVVTAKLKPIPPLAPRFHEIDARPEYVMLGGLVFSKVSVPLIQTNLGLYKAGETAIWIDVDYADSYKQRPTHEIVVLINVLKHDVNIGVPLTSKVVKYVDDERVESLKHLAKIALKLNTFEPPPTNGKSTSGNFVRIRFNKPSPNNGEDDNKTRRHSLPDIVLDRSKIPEANREICAVHAIPHIISSSLVPKGEEDTNEGKDDVEEGVIVEKE